MSLTTLNHRNLIVMQTRLKLSTNASSFTIFIVIQLLALLSSFQNGTEYFLMEGVISVEVSTAAHVVFAMFWAFISGVNIASRAKWNETFTFISTRLTHHLSNFLYMFITSVIASLILVLIGPALRLLTYVRYGEVTSSTLTITEAPMAFLLQFLTALIYMFFLFILGYTISSIFQSGKLLDTLALVGICLLLFFFNFVYGLQLTESIITFFLAEDVFLFFLLKMFIVIGLLCGASLWATNRNEVRNS